MLFRRSDLPLDTDPAGGFLPWIVGLMVYLAALALAGAVLADGLVERWRSDLADAVTVQVFPEDEPGALTQPARVEEAVRFLEVMPGIASAEPVPQAEIVRLLDPWLGSGNLTEDLPLPGLIAVELVPGAPVDLADIKRRLAEAVPGAVLEDHKPWLGDLSRLARGIEVLALVTMALVAVASVLTIVFVSRSALAQHQEVIQVLSLIGARDSYIAAQLQAYSFRLATLGAAFGVALAIATVLAGNALLGRTETGLLPMVQSFSWHWALLLLPVPAAGLIALATTRATVLRQLRRMA
ncbi:MAG TPA: cell division protein [Methylomirabilota bacterium]|jgi:cell division transport system permease protein|nr:cell division protein [Methylomirabilota bacterium]